MEKQKEKYLKRKKLIGKGAYASVWLVVDQKDGNEYALKEISFLTIQTEPDLRDHLKTQIQSMKSINSPHVIKLVDVFRQQHSVGLLLEYCNGGNLYDLQSTQPDGVFSLRKAKKILVQVIEGMITLHQEGFVHRDIKPQNILIHREGNKEMIKLADLGFCKKYKEVKGTVLGTELLMSPEIYSESYGMETDVWAFGITFFFMLNLDFPFRSDYNLSRKEKEAIIISLATNFSYSNAVEETKLKKTENCTEEMEDLFQRMFQPNKEKRITFEEIQNHPVFQFKSNPQTQPESDKMLSSEPNSGSKKQIQFSSKILKKAEHQRSIIQNKKDEHKFQKFQKAQSELPSEMFEFPNQIPWRMSYEEVHQRIAELQKQRKLIDQQMVKALQMVSHSTPTIIEEMTKYFEERAKNCQEELKTLYQHQNH